MRSVRQWFMHPPSPYQKLRKFDSIGSDPTTKGSSSYNISGIKACNQCSVKRMTVNTVNNSIVGGAGILSLNITCRKWEIEPARLNYGHPGYFWR